MSAPLSVMLSYYCIGFTGVIMGYLYLRDIFGKPRAWYKPVGYLLYFLVRFTHDIGVYYGGDELVGPPVFRLASVMVAYLWGLLSFVVIMWTFEGDKLKILLVAFFVNFVFSADLLIATMLSDLLMGLPLDGYAFTPFDASIVLAVALGWLLFYLFRRPTLEVSRWACDIAERHRTFLTLTMLVLSMLFLTYAATDAMYASGETLFVMLVIVAICAIVPIVVVQYLSSREAQVREQAIRQCVDLITGYDKQVKAQLALLERDHALFNQNREVLARLERGTSDPALRQRIRDLEAAYQCISHGTFCDQPSLDAVLVAYAQRLRDLGQECQFSVAVPGEVGLGHALVAYTLLDAAAAGARRSRGTQGSMVELRIRRVGDSLLYHLETPATWGPLHAERLLGALFGTNVRGVHERVEGNRTVVLVLRAGDGS